MAKKKSRLQVAEDHNPVRSDMEPHEISENLPEKNLNWKTGSRSEDHCSRLDSVCDEVYKLRTVNFCGQLFPFLQVKMLCKVPLVLELKK